ncbi:MAG: hypothetical protein NZ473_05205 [Candidatus Kapabacteria bacterium]|nr:hypothetical protein [Candidatus Kapabacteria bacterium]MDW8225806.1 hypothetical protein [Bacteroidota bacterium]
MRPLLPLGLAVLLACAPSRQSEPATEPPEILLDTAPRNAQPYSDTIAPAVPQTEAEQSTKEAAQQAKQPRRVPATQPTTTAPQEGVQIRTTKKPRNGASQQTQQPTSPQPAEESGIEIRTKKKERNP